MFKEVIRGFNVELPFSPYPSQVQTIDAILDCMVNRKHGLIESPTGTGKSLSVLSSVISWLNSMEKEARPKVYICSRTHKQIEQLINQMKKLNNVPDTSVLASREHLCRNSAVMKETDKENACRKAVKNSAGPCIYFQNKEKLDGLKRIFNIEDITTYGDHKKVCPYYAARDLSRKADIVFAPYNYVVSPMVSKVMEIDLEDAVLIIDEGHNIEDVCRSAGSAEIDSYACTGIKIAIENEKAAQLRDSPDDIETRMGWLDSVMGMAVSMEEYIEKKKKEISGLNARDISGKEREIAIKEEDTREEMAKMGLSSSNIGALTSAVKSIAQEGMLNTIVLQKLTQLVFVASIMLSPSEKRYCIVVSEEKVSFLCLHAEVIFEPIADACRSVVLLSGTLQPFDETIKELFGRKKKEILRVEAPHVIDKKQVLSVAVSSYENTSLLGTYQGMKDDGYIRGVCKIIEEVATSLAHVGGTLCFFPNYAVLEKISKLVKNITVYAEPQEQRKFERTIADYRKSCRFGRCVFLCVFRGRASEGVDFRNHEARAVIVIGVPYPSMYSQAIISKKEYNRKYMNDAYGIWYENQAYRAVNQAIGRCIRHKDDWGSIFFLDARYATKKSLGKISRWARETLRPETNFGTTKSMFEQFVKEYSEKDKASGHLLREEEDVENFQGTKRKLDEQKSTRKIFRFQ